MDNGNVSSNALKTLFKGICESLKNVIKESQDYTNIKHNNTLNQHCTDDLNCQDTKLFCNLTTNLCQCARFYTRNADTEMCEIEYDRFLSWLKENTTHDTSYQAHAIYMAYSKSDIHWAITATMCFGLACIFMCAIYACLGDKNEENVSSKVPGEKHEEESLKIEIPAMDTH